MIKIQTKNPRQIWSLLNTAISQKTKKVFYVTMLIGLLTHAFMLNNKISFHDDMASLFGVGTTIESGRWGLEVFFILNCIFLNTNVSMPMVNGMVSIFFISVAVCLLLRIIKTDEIFLGGYLVGALMVCFPVVASTFCFMFTAPYYFLALLLNMWAAYELLEKDRWIRTGVLLGVGLSLYQPYITVFFVVFIIRLIQNQWSNHVIKKSFVQIYHSVISIILGALFWYFGNIIWKWIYHMDYADSGRLSSAMNMSLSEIWKGVQAAYINFFSVCYQDYKGLSNGHGIHIIFGIMIGFLIVKGFMDVLSRRMQTGQCVLYIMLLGVFPLAVGFMSVLSIGGWTDVHTLMLYSYVFIFIFFMVSVADFLRNYFIKKENVKNIVYWIALVVILWGIIYYMRLDNMAYVKVDFLQQQTNAYFNTLVTRIQALEGYQDDLQVAVVNSLPDSYDLGDESLTEDGWHGKITIYGADWNANKWITDYAWKDYVKYHCGYEPSYVEDCSQWEEYVRKEKMPCYPDDGSIVLVDNVIVVNMDSLSIEN